MGEGGGGGIDLFVKASFTPATSAETKTVQHAYLGHFLPVSFRVQWCFGQQDWMFFWCNTEFIVEGMMPDLNRNRKKLRKRNAYSNRQTSITIEIGCLCKQ